MIEPNALLDAWVATLQNTPALTAALAGGSKSIAAYRDGLSATNLRQAVYQMAPGSVLVAWNGFGPNARGRVRHTFSLFLRAWEKADYGKLCWLLVEGVPEVAGTDAGLKLLQTRIHLDCDPMDLEMPRAQRNVIVVGDGSVTVDYFEFQAGLVEIGAGSR